MIRRIAFLFIALCMALSVTSCDEDFDEAFAENGDPCDNPGQQFCNKKGLLMVCEYADMYGMTEAWHSYACPPGSFCRKSSGKSDCYYKCTKEEVGTRNPQDSYQICTQIDNEYFYVY